MLNQNLVALGGYPMPPFGVDLVAWVTSKCDSLKQGTKTSADRSRSFAIYKGAALRTAGIVLLELVLYVPWEHAGEPGIDASAG
jgi:hypothetical protein